MVIIRATRRLVSAGTRRPGAALRGTSVLSEGPLPDVGPLGTWVANVVPLPYPGRSLVLFTATDVLLSVVASGRALRTTIPVFQRRLPILLLRLGLPGAWIQARADGVKDVHVARVGAQTADRRVLGSMNDLTMHVHAMAEDAGAFDLLDLDVVEDRLARVLLSVLGDGPRDYGRAAEAVAELARA